MDAAASSANDPTRVPILRDNLPQPAREILVDMEDRMHKTAERRERHVATARTRIHRFPHNLKGIGGTGGRYVVPSVVAFGPYHRGLPHLQDHMEAKIAAAYNFCRDAGRSVEEVYGKILGVASDVRRCYDDVVAAGLSDAEFAAMMFQDGCFLLRLMAKTDEPPFVGFFSSSGPSILKDMFMLENQIPWLVLEALMEFGGLTPEEVGRWIIGMMGGVFFHGTKERPQTPQCVTIEGGDLNNKPPHLLGLFRHILICSVPPRKELRRYCSDDGGWPLMSCSAVHLAQIGVKLTARASKVGCFADMDVHRKHIIFGELSLSPMFVNDAAASYLVNLAALEAAQASTATSWDEDGYVVTSYLSVLAMLMDREEDVHELRRRCVLRSNFSNKQTLAFFKGLGQHLRMGSNYHKIMEDVNKYKRKNPVKIAVHKFLYNNYRTMAAVLSFIGALISILQALYSHYNPQPALGS